MFDKLQFVDCSKTGKLQFAGRSEVISRGARRREQYFFFVPSLA
jgi:hypothetical protein